MRSLVFVVPMFVGVLLAGCLPMPQAPERTPMPQPLESAPFDLTPSTVSSAILTEITTGYGIRLTFTDYGWNKLKQLSAPKRQVPFMVGGHVITTEIVVSSQIPKELLWTRSVGIDEFTKEEAEELIKIISEK